MRKTDPAPCVTRTVARGEVGRIDVCDECGVLTLHIGPVSLRLERDALKSLDSTIAQAMRILEGARSSSDDPDATGVHRKWVARGRA
ncbi:MAG TPA: hypothetical protein VIM73_19275 [Polyangiaceae bacterium]